MVNTWFDANNEPITERLVPKPINWDEVEFPPSPKGSPPRSFVPLDDPQIDQAVEQAIPDDKSNVCETCGCMKKHVRKPEAKWLKMSKEKASSWNRKLDEVDSRREQRMGMRQFRVREKSRDTALQLRRFHRKKRKL